MVQHSVDNQPRDPLPGSQAQPIKTPHPQYNHLHVYTVVCWSQLNSVKILYWHNGNARKIENFISSVQ